MTREQLIEKYTKRKDFYYKNWRKWYHRMADDDRDNQRAKIEIYLDFIECLENLDLSDDIEKR